VICRVSALVPLLGFIVPEALALPFPVPSAPPFYVLWILDLRRPAPTFETLGDTAEKLRILPAVDKERASRQAQQG